MLKRKITLFMLLIAGALTSHAQHRMADGNIAGPGGNNNADDVPEVSENVGADLYTGKLTAGFSLFSYKSNASGLTHNISISYDGGGNKVDEVASSLGANWTLNTGGYIVREINGLPDEVQSGFTSTTMPVTPVNALDSFTLMQYVSSRDDGQFDIYYFDAGGTTGRFIIGKNGEIQTIPRMNITIETGFSYAQNGSLMDSCDLKSFMLTLENGTRYWFSDFNCQKANYYNGNNPYYVSTKWYLTKIISALGTDTISFSYLPSAGDEQQPHREFYGYVEQINGQPAITQEFVGDIPPTVRKRRMNIDHIDYPDGTVVSFDYLYNRLDFHTDRALNFIEISNGGSSYAYKFLHSYMNRAYNGQPVTTADIAFADYEHTNATLWNSNNVETLYSLQLDSFYRYSGQKKLAGYGFKYNPICLPPVGSDKCVDLWGYFNGTNEERKTQFTDGTNTYYASFRYPDIQYAIAKSLQKINLPTGGSIRFSYELNTTKSAVTPNDMGITSISNVGGLRIKQIVHSDATGQTNDLVKTYQYTEADGITSSGVMANFPRFGYIYHEYSDPNTNMNFNYSLACIQAAIYNGNSASPIPAYTNNVFLIRNGDPLNRILYTHGGVVGYGRVTEYTGTPTKNIGKTIYSFSTANDYPVSAGLMNNEFPFPYIPDNDFVWGLPTAIERYNGAGVLLSVKQNRYTVYTYSLDNDNFRSLKLGIKNHPPHNLSDYGYKYYYPVTGKVFLTKQITTAYFASNKTTRDSAIYNYDTAHNVLRNVVTTNANDEQIKTQFYYPFDFSVSLPAMKALQVNHADRAFPVRTEKWNMAPATPRLLDVSVILLDTIYGNFYSVNGTTKYKGLVKPKSSYDFSPLQPVDANIWGNFNSTVLLPNPAYFTLVGTMDKYDVRGNLLQTTVKGSISSSIFDEAGRNKIASVTNGTYADIAYTSFEDNSRGGWTENSTYLNPPSMPDHFVTGDKGFAMLYNNLGRAGLNTGTKYTVSLWVYSGSPKLTINGGTTVVPLVSSETHNGWQLYKADITGATDINISTNNTATIIDELRLYPSTAAMATTSYDPLYGTTSVCDIANHTVYNIYDELGRIRFGKDADGNVRKAFNYQQQEQQ